MTPAAMRKDAARNWQRITDVGRQLVDDGTPLQLNEVARLAGVGVATVYRHFPTPEALLETLAAPGLEALVALAERALADNDAGRALKDFLEGTMDLQLTDPAISAVRAAPLHVLPRTTELAATLDSLAGRVLDRAGAAGAVNRTMTWTGDLLPLMCGVAYATAVHTDDRKTQLEAGRRYLGVLLQGIRASST